MHPLKSYLSDINEPVQDFAVRLGTSRQTLHRIFSGAMDPRPALAKRIVEATGGAVTFEMLYRYRASCSDLPACGSPLDRIRIRSVLSIVVSYMAPKGTSPPSPDLADAASDAVMKIHEALNFTSLTSEQGRITRSLRPVLDELLQAYGVSPTASALDHAAHLGLKLYEETGTFPADH